MTTHNLGRIEEVDLRQIWQHEANDFTPWLAKHLDLLGEALHLDLTLVESEGEVGPFAVDVVADSSSGLVVIENQLEQTDHSHLGQLLTYAVGRDARILIWITPRFRDEHRAVLDWLNHWTPEEIEVYGVEARAIRIDASRPAPEFRAVAFPNAWSRQAGTRRRVGRALTADYQRRNAFFQALIDEARPRGLTDEPTTKSTHYQSFPCQVNLSRIEYWVHLRPQDGVQVYLEINTNTGDTDTNQRIIDALYESREAIEAEMGFEPQWQKPDGRRKMAHVRMVADGSIDDPEERQADVRTWLLDTLGAMKSALDPRLQQIVAELDAEEADGVGRGLSSDDL